VLGHVSDTVIDSFHCSDVISNGGLCFEFALLAGKLDNDVAGAARAVNHELSTCGVPKLSWHQRGWLGVCRLRLLN
jgi:hypothetical protein